jgi:hypothetical protein
MDVEHHMDVDRYMGGGVMQALAVEPVGLTEERSEHVLKSGLLSIALVTAVLVFWALVLLVTVSPVVGGAALMFAGLVGLVDALFVTATRVRVDGRDIEVRSVARSTTYDGDALIARRASGHRYGLAAKERPRRTVAWMRERDLGALRGAGVDIG